MNEPLVQAHHSWTSTSNCNVRSPPPKCSGCRISQCKASFTAAAHSSLLCCQVLSKNSTWTTRWPRRLRRHFIREVRFAACRSLVDMFMYETCLLYAMCRPDAGSDCCSAMTGCTLQTLCALRAVIACTVSPSALSTATASTARPPHLFLTRIAGRETQRCPTFPLCAAQTPPLIIGTAYNTCYHVVAGHQASYSHAFFLGLYRSTVFNSVWSNLVCTLSAVV